MGGTWRTAAEPAATTAPKCLSTGRNPVLRCTATRSNCPRAGEICAGCALPGLPFADATPAAVLLRTYGPLINAMRAIIHR